MSAIRVRKSRRVNAATRRERRVLGLRLFSTAVLASWMAIVHDGWPGVKRSISASSIQVRTTIRVEEKEGSTVRDVRALTSFCDRALHLAMHVFSPHPGPSLFSAR